MNNKLWNKYFGITTVDGEVIEPEYDTQNPPSGPSCLTILAFYVPVAVLILLGFYLIFAAFLR